MLESNDEAVMTGQRDREITLGTTTILGIFFALAVLCAGFFAFGYSLGSKHTTATASVAEPASPSVSSTIFSAFKPAAGSTGNRVQAPHETVTVPVPVPVDAEPGAAAAGTAKAVATKARAADKAFAEAVPVEEVAVTSTSRKAAVASTAPIAPVAVQPVPVVAVGAPGVMQAVVQIAAVTHQEDADLIASTLKRRGYSVNVRQEPQDKLLHVQVGPFANKKDADAMRQRLLADGFNAFVK